MRTGCGSVSQAVNALGINLHINLNDWTPERRDDLELSSKTDVIDKAPFRTSGEDRYRTKILGK